MKKILKTGAKITEATFFIFLITTVFYVVSNLNGDLLGKYLYGPPLKSSLDPSFDELKTCMILKKRIKIEDAFIS